MNERMKEAFDKIHAEETLKAKTKAYLAAEARRPLRHHPRKFPRLAAAAACLLLFLTFGAGYQLYLVPTSTISIDVNPSLELRVNRFDKVVSVEGYNEDGQDLAASLDIRFVDYEEAVEQILESETITACLAQDEILTFTVVGDDKTQRGEMLSTLESCTSGRANTYCYDASSSEVEDAHEAGLSYGKYRAYLELQELDPDITPEDVKDMTMRQIRDLADALSEDGQENDAEKPRQENQRQGGGQQHRGGRRQGSPRNPATNTIQTK